MAADTDGARRKWALPAVALEAVELPLLELDPDWSLAAVDA